MTTHVLIRLLEISHQLVHSIGRILDLHQFVVNVFKRVRLLVDDFLRAFEDVLEIARPFCQNSQNRGVLG
jgi:hypothetical protein